MKIITEKCGTALKLSSTFEGVTTCVLPKGHEESKHYARNRYWSDRDGETEEGWEHDRLVEYLAQTQEPD